MVTNLTQLGYVNNYDKNRYLEKFSKAAVVLTSLLFLLLGILKSGDIFFNDKEKSQRHEFYSLQ